MINYTKGNLLEADVEALVNAVNTVGVMGKGIALMFKEAFPDNFKEYAIACKANKIEVGHIHASKLNDLYDPKWIIHFPTKKHWRQPSEISWIIDGLQDLRRFIVEKNIKSIAIPALGSGNGQLKWEEVKSQIEIALNDLKDINIVVYEPQ